MLGWNPVLAGPTGAWLPLLLYRFNRLSKLLVVGADWNSVKLFELFELFEVSGADWKS